VIISIPFIAYFYLSAKSYLEGQSLINESELPSLYLFQFDAGRVVTIRDDHNMFVRSWGGSAHEILIENGVRILKFDEAAILKTDIDSIEPQEEYVKVKGYMGVYTQDTEFHVNVSGDISSDNWSGG
jgi:hypothetical protein